MKYHKFDVLSEYETVSDLKPVDKNFLAASKQTNTKLQADKVPTSPTITSKCKIEETTNSEITNSSLSNSKTGNQLRFLLPFLFEWYYTLASFKNYYVVISYIGFAHDIFQSLDYQGEFQQKYGEAKSKLLEMGFELQQIDNAVLSTQSVQMDDLLEKLASSGI